MYITFQQVSEKMKVKKNVFPILGLFFLVIACSAYRNSKTNNSQKNMEHIFGETSLEKYGNDTICQTSPSNSYILCRRTSKDSLLNPNSLTKFFVFSKAEQKIIYEDAIAGVQISWRNDTLLLINQQKGIISSTADPGKIQYFIDLKNHTKIPIDRISYNNK